MKKSILFIGLIVIALIVSCKKEEDVFETLISGNVSEGNSGQPIAGSIIYILRYKDSPVLPDSTFDLIDSVISGPEGNYMITLKTTNKVDDRYFWKAVLDEKYVYNTRVENIRLGQPNVFNLVGFQPAILKARIIWSNNPKPPLYISTSSFAFNRAVSSLQLHKISGDTTVLLKLVPAKQNQIHFYYLDYYYWWLDEKPELPASLDTLHRTYTVDFQKFIRGHKAD